MVTRKSRAWGKELNLLNGTGIKYRQLKIPCCHECNTKYLQELEKEICEAAKLGYEYFKTIDELKIFQWLSKIFYGLLFKQLNLLINRKLPDEGAITTPDLLQKYKILYNFLQSIREPFVFEEPKPWSIFIFKVINYDDERNFNYRDSLFTLNFSIRFGDIGITTCLLDNGIHKKFFNEIFDKYRQIELANIQFDEICAVVQYKTSLMNRTPNYLIKLPDKRGELTTIYPSPLAGLSSKSIWNDWIMKDFVNVLHSYWLNYDLPKDMILPDTSKGECMTYLKDQNGFIQQFNKKNEVVNLIKINSKNLEKNEQIKN